MITEITQFFTALILAWIATRSIRFWSGWGIKLLGLIALPLLALAFFAGSYTPLWDAIGSTAGQLISNTITGIQALFSALPVLATGAAIGVLIGSGLLQQRQEW